MVNRDKPHLFVLPEDDADLQIANGFWLQLHWSRQRQMQVLPGAGGWSKVLSSFESVHVPQMDRCPARFMVLLFDLDDDPNRLERSLAKIPDRLSNRVFILGVLSDPEKLKAALGARPCEKIGSDMAEDCRTGTDVIWGHVLLKHNSQELDRLRVQLCPILFPNE